MPTQTVSVEAEVFVEHDGVVVYHTYKDDDIDQGESGVYFRVNDGDDEAQEFDVRDLPGYTPMSRGCEAYEVREAEHEERKKAVIKAAIDSGILSEDGVKPKREWNKSVSEVAMGCRYVFEATPDYESIESDARRGVYADHDMYPITDLANSDLVGILTDCSLEFVERVVKLLNEQDANGGGLPRPVIGDSEGAEE